VGYLLNPPFIPPDSKGGKRGGYKSTLRPTQKPEELMRKILLASSNKDDLVIDPFVGSGTTCVAAEQLKRKWKGCDNSLDYLQWASQRIELVPNWPIEEWLRIDFENEKRRKSIR
jgi:site-specific DNA-methyltransferase (adenine-specific)